MRLVLATALALCVMLTGCQEEKPKPVQKNCGYSITFQLHTGKYTVKHYDDIDVARADRKRLIRLGYEPHPVVIDKCTQP